MQEKVGKKIILEVLSFLRYKIENDFLTMEEVESVSKLIENSLAVLGTADDFARYFGKPKTNISSVINRRMMEKPVRKVFYRFSSFLKIVPDKWISHGQLRDPQ